MQTIQSNEEYFNGILRAKNKKSLKITDPSHYTNKFKYGKKMKDIFVKGNSFEDILKINLYFKYANYKNEYYIVTEFIFEENEKELFNKFVNCFHKLENFYIR